MFFLIGSPEKTHPDCMCEMAASTFATGMIGKIGPNISLRSRFE